MSDPLLQSLKCTLKVKTLADIVNVIPVMSERDEGGRGGGKGCDTDCNGKKQD